MINKYVFLGICFTFISFQALAQVSPSIALGASKVNPGYLGKKSFVGYELGIASSYISLASFLDENKDSRFVPIHNLYYERVVSKKTAFGVVASFSHSYGASLTGTYRPKDISDFDLHHPDFEGLVDDGTIPSNWNAIRSLSYQFNMDRSRTSGFGVGLYLRRYFGENYAPIGWFYDLQLAIQQHTTTDIDYELQYSIGDDPEIQRAMESIDYSKMTTSFVVGLGHTWGLTDNLLLTLGSYYNVNAITNYYAFGNYKFSEDKQNSSSLATENNSFQEFTELITSTRTYYFNLVQIRFGIRYAF
ncbi:MAG: hypothetical protein LAT76_08400 [Schleiferiaceae bacterium]|nr:hypothetical protein [Schleiferiaceae bacterium]